MVMPLGILRGRCLGKNINHFNEPHGGIVAYYVASYTVGFKTYFFYFLS